MARASPAITGTIDASIPLSTRQPGTAQDRTMGVVIAFPHKPRAEAHLVVRLWELVASGQRDSEAYRCLEAEIRRRRSIDDAARQVRDGRHRR
jgi:hypothetical protein